MWMILRNKNKSNFSLKLKTWRSRRVTFYYQRNSPGWQLSVRVPTCWRPELVAGGRLCQGAGGPGKEASLHPNGSFPPTKSACGRGLKHKGFRREIRNKARESP